MKTAKALFYTYTTIICKVDFVGYYFQALSNVAYD